MPTLNSVVQNFVVGDALLLTRNVSGVNPADAAASAKLTVKEWREDTGYIFQKSITSTPVTGQGQITASGAVGSGDGTAGLTFELTMTNTGRLVPNRAYYFDIEITTVGNVKYTGQTGLIIGGFQTTI